MNDIILENNDKWLKKVTLSNEIIQKIASIEQSLNCSSSLKPLLPEMYNNDLANHMYAISSRIEYLLNFYLSSKSEYDPYFVNHLVELNDRYSQLKDIPIRIFRNDVNAWKKIIDISLDVYKTTKDMSRLLDYQSSKEEVFANFPYLSESILSSSQKKKLYEEYEQALNTRDIPKLKEIVNIINQKIILDWQQVGKNIDQMTDDNFCFLGHSTRTTGKIDEFYHPLLSASLYTSEINDTFKDRFGFILPPKGIVAASPKDLYTDNSFENKEEMFYIPNIVKIDHPNLIISQNKTLLRNNASTNERKTVYNEIVIDVSKSFSPIGVFCFTNGALDYDESYVKAKELAKNNNLPLYVFDILDQKKGYGLLGVQQELLNSILQKRASNINEYNPINIESLNYYQYFFKEFKKLKQTKDYTTDQINAIFARNVDLITNTISGTELFSGKYSDLEISTILKSNFWYNLDHILNTKTYNYSILQNLVNQLTSNIKNLDEYYSGLSNFIFVLAKLGINNETINIMQGANTTSIYELTKSLAMRLKDNLKKENQQNMTLYAKLNQQYSSLTAERQDILKKQQEYTKAQKLNQNAWRFPMIKRVYENMVTDLENIQEKIIKKEETKQELERSKDELEHSKVEINSNLNEIQTDFAKKIEDKQKLEASLKKHPYFNYLKLKKISQEIKNLEMSQAIAQKEKKLAISNQQSEISSKIDKITSEIFSVTRDISKLKKDISKAKITLKEQITLLQELYGSSNLDQIAAMLQDSEKIISEYDFANDYNLDTIERQLADLSVKIQKLENLNAQNKSVYTNITSYEETGKTNIYSAGSQDENISIKK